MRKFIVSNFFYNYICKTNSMNVLALHFFAITPFFLIKYGNYGFIPLTLTLLSLLLGKIGKFNSEVYTSIPRSIFVMFCTGIVGVTAMASLPDHVNIIFTIMVLLGILSGLAEIIYNKIYGPKIIWEHMDKSQKWEHGKVLSRLDKANIKEWDLLDRYFKTNYKFK